MSALKAPPLVAKVKPASNSAVIKKIESNKWYVGVTLVLLLGLFVFAAIIGIQTMVKFDSDKKKKETPNIIWIGIVVNICVVALMTMPVWLYALMGLKLMNTMSLFMGAAAAGVLVLLFHLKRRYTGDVVLTDTGGICPDGKPVTRDASKECKLNKCSSPVKSVWSWWEVPAMGIGGIVLGIVAMVLLYKHVKE